MYILQKWFENGMYYISDLSKPNGKIMSYK